MTFDRIVGEALPAVRTTWIDVCVAASNAGGAIGFAEPVGPEEIAPLVDVELAAVEQVRRHNQRRLLPTPRLGHQSTPGQPDGVLTLPRP